MPLVSVLVPVFNSAKTLPYVVASLQAQSFEDWECIVVDDGSQDRPGDIIEMAADKRFRFFRLDRNMGRGVARQITIDKAEGFFVTNLDADDWILPEKLQRQVDLYEKDPGLSAVSTAMFVTDSERRLLGVRNSSALDGELYGSLDRVRMPPFPTPPCMLRTALARQTGFDPALRRSQDVDFLLRALLGKRYAVINEPLYVYVEDATLAKGSRSLNYCCQMFRKHIKTHPIDSTREILRARLKQVVYHTAAAFGGWDRLVARRTSCAHAPQVERYEREWEALSERIRAHGLVNG